SVSRAVQRFTVGDVNHGVLDVRLQGSLEDNPRKAGELTFTLSDPQLARPWGDRATVRARVRVSPAFVGTGKRNWHQSHHARLFVEDAGGKRQFLPHTVIVDRPSSGDGWISLS